MSQVAGCVEGGIVLPGLLQVFGSQNRKTSNDDTSCKNDHRPQGSAQPAVSTRIGGGRSGNGPKA